MREIINDPEIQKSVTTYRAGELLFLEGDDSRDLYILVSGRLAVLKTKLIKLFHSLTD